MNIFFSSVTMYYTEIKENVRNLTKKEKKRTRVAITFPPVPFVRASGLRFSIVYAPRYTAFGACRATTAVDVMFLLIIFFLLPAKRHEHAFPSSPTAATAVRSLAPLRSRDANFCSKGRLKRGARTMRTCVFRSVQIIYVDVR